MRFIRIDLGWRALINFPIHIVVCDRKIILDDFVQDCSNQFNIPGFYDVGAEAIASASPAHCIRPLAEKFCGVIKSFIKNPYQNLYREFLLPRWDV